MPARTHDKYHPPGRRGLRVLVLTIVIAAQTVTLYGAQHITTVLLPDAALSVSSTDPPSDTRLVVTSDESYQPTGLSYFIFPPPTLPPNAIVHSAELRLVSNGSSNSQAAQLFSVVSFDADTLNWGNKPLPSGPALAGSSQPGIFTDPTCGPAGLCQEVQEHFASSTPFYLVVRAQGYKTNLSFESSANDTSNNQPRLLVEYSFAAQAKLSGPQATGLQATMSELPATMSWPQPQHDAAHSGRNAWKANAAPSGVQAALRSVFSPTSGTIHQNPILYRGNLYFSLEVDGETGKQYTLRGVTPGGTTVSQSGPLKALPIVQPVVDPHGILYYATADGVSLFDLDNEITSVKLPPKVSEDLATAQLDSAPTVGLDGSIFFSIGGVVSARTSYPQLKTLWSSQEENGTEAASTAVSPDQRVAYLSTLVRRQAGQAVVLRALNNLTGERLASYETKAAQFERPPTPVAASAGVYLAVTPRNMGASNPSKLFGFRTPEKNQSSWTPSWTKQGTVSPGISQPAIGLQGEVLATHDHKLWAYEPDQGTAEYEYTIAAPAASSNTVLDGDGNITLFAGSTLYSLSKALKEHYTADLSADISSNLLPSPGGLLYVNNGEELYVVLPNLSLPPVPAGLSLSPADYAVNGSVFRAGTSVTVTKGSLLSLAKIVVQSGGEIFLEPEFEVEKKAWLVLQGGLEMTTNSSPNKQNVEHAKGAQK